MRPCATGVPWGPSIRSAVFQQASGLAITTPFGWWTIKSMEEEERREKRRRQRQQVVNCCKQLAAFLFSHIGLAAMVVAYSIMGGFLFQAIEGPKEKLDKQKTDAEVVAFRENKVIEILGIVSNHAPNLTEPVRTFLNETLGRILKEVQLQVKEAVNENGWDGTKDTDVTAYQWSLAGAILYAVTVVTTIGYGHIAPKTVIGRIVTILYALVGIPLTFLYLSNIGNFLADCFRLFYKKICCDIICCQKCERKRKRERLKLRRQRERAAQRNILGLGGPGVLSTAPGIDDPDFRSEGGGDGDGNFPLFDACAERQNSAVGENPRFELETTHCDNNDPASNSATETFPSRSSVSRSRSSDSSARSEMITKSLSSSFSSSSSSERGSVETVRETAILDDDDDDDNDSRGEYGVRETDIISDNVDYDDDDNGGGGRSLSSSNHRLRFRLHRLKGAKETDILDNDDDDNRTSRHHHHPRTREKNPQSLLTSRKKEAKRYQSDPFIHVESNPVFPERRNNNKRIFNRSLTVNSPPRINNTSGCNDRKLEALRRGASQVARSNSKGRKTTMPLLTKKKVTSGSGSGARQKTRDGEAKEKAKANWKKLIEYGKKVAEKEQIDGKQSAKNEPFSSTAKKKTSYWKKAEKALLPLERNSTEMKKPAGGGKRGLIRPLWTMKNPAFDGGTEEATGGTTGSFKHPQKRPTDLNCNIGAFTPESKRVLSSFHNSDESFVTAATDSAASTADYLDDQERDDAEEEEEEEEERNDRRGRALGLYSKKQDWMMEEKFQFHNSGDSIAINIVSPEDDDDNLDPDVDYPAGFLQPDQQISFNDDPFDYEEEDEQEEKVTVPVSICLIIITGYLLAGWALFAVWEEWDIVTGAYFCFITLSTIGFGDIVPGTGTEIKGWGSEAKLVLCALWLAFGLSLLAMCFNLMQEEVKDKCKWIGQKLGILKDEGQN